MATRAVLAITVSAFLGGGCDVSQKKPEVSSQRDSANFAVGEQPLAIPVLPRSVVETPSDSHSGSSALSGGGKSIRLFGPGVSRKRQTRV